MTTTETMFDAPAQEAPAAEPAAQPEAPAVWEPTAGWGHEDHTPLRDGCDPKGNAALALKVRSRRPLQGAVAADQAEARERLRADVLAEVENSSEFHRLVGVRPLHRAALEAARQAEAKAAPLRARKADLRRQLPVPKDLAQKLAKASAELEAAEAELRQREAELNELRPVFEGAAEEVRALVQRACQRAHADALGREAHAVREGMASFARDCSERLTRLYVLARRRHGLTRPNPAALAALVIDAPDAGEA
jgi:hypothetical protein